MCCANWWTFCAEIERGQQLRTLFALAERVIAEVVLSAESVRYYASLVEYYTVYQLRRMEHEAVQLYLLCFVRDRYQRLNDNLLGAFCSLVRRYVQEVATATKEAIYRSKLQTGEDIEQGAKVMALFLDSIDGRMPFASVRDQAHALLPAERLQQLCRHLAGEGARDEGGFEWREVDAIMTKVKRNLRPLLRFLILQGTPAYARLLETLSAMTEAFERGEPLPVLTVSTVLVPTRAKRYLFESSGAVIRDRYEFKLYTALPTINARHSSKYFDLSKGVAAYTLSANHVPLNARIIGVNEHESHYVFDMLFNNAADILPAIHSTDTHCQFSP